MTKSKSAPHKKHLGACAIFYGLEEEKKVVPLACPPSRACNFPKLSTLPLKKLFSPECLSKGFNFTKGVRTKVIFGRRRVMQNWS